MPVYQPMAPMEVSLMGCFTEAGHSLLNVKHACEKEGNAGIKGSRVKHIEDEGRSVCIHSTLYFSIVM